MAELAVLLTVYHGSAADSVFYRKKKIPLGGSAGAGWAGHRGGEGTHG